MKDSNKVNANEMKQENTKKETVMKKELTVKEMLQILIDNGYLTSGNKLVKDQISQVYDLYLSDVKKEEAKKKRESSQYYKTVINVGKKLKELLNEECKTFGYPRRILLDYAKEIELKESFVSILESTIGKSNSDNYKYLSDKIRTSKKGKFNTHYVLQYLYTNEEQILKDFDLISTLGKVA